MLADKIEEVEGCACCGILLGRPGTSSFPLCDRCPAHVLPEDEDQRAPWHRTYFALYGVECPFAEDE